MNMLQRILSLLVSLCLVSGCGGPAGPGRDGAPAPLPRPDGGEAPVLSDGLAFSPDGLSGFGVELLKQSRKEGENTLLSPLSVALALGMTANGADKATLEQFQRVFGMELDGLNGLCAGMLKEYSALGGSTQANLANSLWADPDLAMEDAFLRACMDLYGAQVFQRDLQDPGTAGAVNAWVKEATRDMIPAIVDRFDDSAVLALVNAVYLKNQFKQPFETPYSDWTMDFTTEDGTVSHPLGMSNGTRQEQYIKTDSAQGVVLPYDDGRLGLLLMRPEDGVSVGTYLDSWNGGTAKALLDAKKSARVELQVPKFKAEWSSSLVSVLRDMGLSDAFDADRADFGRMGNAKNNAPLYIGDVVHKTAFEVNEKGTEAAAVTAVVMECGSAMPPDDLIHLRFDRPFIYGIVDLETGFPLFLGTAETL